MNSQQQQAIDTALDQTLGDDRLSGAEEKALREVIEGLSGNREALAFIRNRAFRKARERIEQAPLDMLRWLERIDKIVDNTASPPDEHDGDRAAVCAFSPGESALEVIRRELRAAKRSLDICVFTITDDRLTEQILAARDRGVDVRIVTDNDKQLDTGSDIMRLVGAGVPTRFDPDSDHMHHKFAIVDGARLINGSYNWTRGATRNHENIMVLTDADTVGRFAKVFEQLWREFREVRR